MHILSPFPLKNKVGSIQHFQQVDVRDNDISFRQIIVGSQ